MKVNISSTDCYGCENFEIMSFLYFNKRLGFCSCECDKHRYIDRYTDILQKKTENHLYHEICDTNLHHVVIICNVKISSYDGSNW